MFSDAWQTNSDSCHKAFNFRFGLIPKSFAQLCIYTPSLCEYTTNWSYFMALWVNCSVLLYRSVSMYVYYDFHIRLKLWCIATELFCYEGQGVFSVKCINVELCQDVISILLLFFTVGISFFSLIQLEEKHLACYS